jgi:acetyl-CoA synthetase
VAEDGLHFTYSDTGWGKASWGKLYGQWFLGAGIFIYDHDKFSVTDMLEKIAKHKVTTFCAPPTIYRHMIKEDLGRYDLSALSYAATAGEALSAEVYEQFLKATGLTIMEGFGQTETTLLTAHTVHMPVKPGSMGKPSVQYDVRILDDEGQETADGVTGEICVRYDRKAKPAGLMEGYYRAPERMNEAVRNGWYRTGDTAWRDEDGYIWYVSRKDDIIKSSGYRIGPFEVESVIMEHPAVLKCAVIGVPDDVRGQAVKAFVVLAKGKTASEQEIQDYCKKHTAPYKYPRAVQFIAELPKTMSGKIKRTELRKL